MTNLEISDLMNQVTGMFADTAMQIKPKDNNGFWVDAKLCDCAWDFPRYDYRVKPIPIKAWCVVRPDRSFWLYKKRSMAEADGVKYPGSRVVPLVEPVEERKEQ